MKIPRTEITPPSAKPAEQQSQTMAEFAEQERQAQLPKVRRNAQLAEQERRALYGNTDVDRHNDFYGK